MSVTFARRMRDFTLPKLTDSPSTAAGGMMTSEYRYAKTSRQQRILAELARAPALRMNELSEALGVSTETIRRDLRELDLRGLVSRT
jgi:DNA-binding MarR family transcriptional regulator